MAAAALVLTTGLAASFGACTSDDNPAPGQQTFTGGNAGNGGSTAGAAGDQTAGGNGGDVASGGGGQGGSGVLPDGGTGGGGPTDATIDTVGCKTDGGCWNCVPIQADPLTFTNHCSSAQCSPFNNQTRLPAQYRDGGLPTF